MSDDLGSENQDPPKVELSAVEYRLPQDEFAILKEGSILWKVRSFNKWYRRKYLLDLDNHRVLYEGSNKFPCLSDPDFFIDIRDITDVRKGWKTDTFNKLGTRVQKQTVRHPGKRPLVDEPTCFSIIFGKPQKTLDLVASNEALRDAWVQGLHQVVAQNRSIEYKQSYELWLRKQFQLADKDHNKTLTFDECVRFLKQLNVVLSETHARKLFAESNVNKQKRFEEDVLDVDEFLIFYQKLLCRPELEQLIRKFGIQNTELMGPQELYIFCVQEQKMQNITTKDCQAMINGFESQRRIYIENHLSLGGFRLFLLSEKQNLFNDDHNDIYQDMTQPLSHYFIASSHNTYLVGDQLTGKSSVEGYIDALNRGCRCVELDIHDGDDSDGAQPIIYHGYTLTSKILLKEVLEDAIKPYAFISSEYPLILSLEVHCSVEQQKIIASHLKNILGDLLYVAPLSGDMESLPSPQSLKRKIIIKAKKLPEDFDNTDDVGGPSGSETEEETLDTNSFPGKNTDETVAKELSDLVILCRSVRFHSFEHNGEKGKFYDLVSLSEKKASRLIADEAQLFVDYTNKQLVRIYPAGKRTDSSNYNPIPLWNVGCQIVALNYQTEDKANLFNRAKFQPNGRCGYILKPKFMLEGSFDPNNPLDGKYMKILQLKIISGQHIPKPGKKDNTDGEVVDPYVVVEVRGHVDDKKKYTTKVVENNGFNPVWDESFTIPIKLPELAFLHFIVRDHSSLGKDEKLGQCIIPFTSVQQGYRHVTLVDQQGSPIPPATLFVHVTITEENRR